MLKKISHILLVLVLFVSTTGMTVSKHYCGGSLVNMTIFSEVKGCCEGGCSSGCCHNESEHFELDEDFVPVTNTLELQEAAIELFLPMIQSLVINIIEQQCFELDSLDPPPPKEVLVFLSTIQVYRL